MEITIEKGIVHIKLNQMPASHNRNSKQSLDSGELSNRREGVSKVQTSLLGEALGNKPSFVSVQGAISIVLNPINPFTPNSPFLSR